MLFKEKVKKEFNNFAKLNNYVEMIEEKNKVMNLTGFSGDSLWEHGIYESIVSLDEINGGKLLDIGAGAGFPSIPKIISNEKISLTIYEPLQKRSIFLNDVNNKLNLKIEIKNIRAEETTEEEKYDYITARAVASLKVLIEISHKPLKIGGSMLFIKGPKAKEEIANAKNILEKFNLSVELISKNINNKEINILKLIKNKKTPKGYPRNWTQIKKEERG